MHDRYDFIPLGVGVYTAGMGGITLADVQTVFGIIATFLGIILTVATFAWRRREHRKRMEQFEGPSERDKEAEADES